MAYSTPEKERGPMLHRGSPSCNESPEGLSSLAFADVADVADVIPDAVSNVTLLCPPPKTIQAGVVLRIVVELHGTYFQRREVRAVATLVGPNAEGKLFGNTTVIGVSVSPILINFCFDLTISKPGRFFVGIHLEEGPFRVSCGHVDSENIIVTAFDQHADPDSSHIPEPSRSPFDHHADPDSSHIPEPSHSPSEVALLKPDPGLPKRKSHEDMCGGTSKKVRFDELTIQVRRKSELAVSFSSAEAPTSTFKEVDGDRRIEDGMAGETTRSRFRSDDREQDKISVEQGDDSAKVMKIMEQIDEVKEKIQEKRMLERRIGSQTDREERRLSPQEVINKVLIWQESISTRARNPTDRFDKESSDMQKSWAVDGEPPTKDSNDQPPNQVSTGEDDIPRFTDSLMPLRCREEDDNEYTYDGYFPWKVRKSPVEVAGYDYVKNELLIPEATILSLDLYCAPESCEVDGILEWGEGLYSDEVGNWYCMCQDEERLSDVDEEDEIWEEGIWKYSKTTGLFRGLWVRLRREVVVADDVRYIAHFVLTAPTRQVAQQAPPPTVDRDSSTTDANGREITLDKSLTVLHKLWGVRLCGGSEDEYVQDALRVVHSKTPEHHKLLCRVAWLFESGAQPLVNSNSTALARTSRRPVSDLSAYKVVNPPLLTPFPISNSTHKDFSMETYVPHFSDAESMTDMASQYDPRGPLYFNGGTYQSNQFWCLRYELNKCRDSFDKRKQKGISTRLTKVQELASFNLDDILATKVDMVVKELLDMARAIPGDKHQIRNRSRKLLMRLNGTKHSRYRWRSRDREAKAGLKDVRRSQRIACQARRRSARVMQKPEQR
ncbi:hypothetical protein V498_06303 [Pseudogymnoascus sp. VKM F-4517 (FW-2822)]|nr:hypothetical protein V498_06303 [Pseudogymnoascus sp. VKM F-4517 (FW-2822)]